jgi:hypothetical protein
MSRTSNASASFAWWAAVLTNATFRKGYSHFTRAGRPEPPSTNDNDCLSRWTLLNPDAGRVS